MTPSPDLLAKLPHWLQMLLALSGPALFLVSVLTSFLSQYVRAQRVAGVRVSPFLLALTGALNFASGNPHKGLRLAKASDAAKEALP